MKKRIFLALAVVLGGTALLVNSCKKDDTTAPVVTLNGSDLTLSLNNTAPSDPGASADDGSTVTSTWSSTNPNMNLAGTYTITYSATDGAGNTGSATRTVTVKNDAAYLNGTYNITETPGTPPSNQWVQTVTASSTVNNLLTFSKFANYANNSGITAKVVPGSTTYVVLYPASQTASDVGTSPYDCNHTFASNGNGTIPVVLSGGKWTFSIKFTDTVTSGIGASCATTGAVAYEDGFQQQ